MPSTSAVAKSALLIFGLFAAGACGTEEGFEVGPGFKKAQSLGFDFTYEWVGEIQGNAGSRPFSFPIVEAGAAAVRDPNPRDYVSFVAGPADRSETLPNGEPNPNFGDPDRENNLAVILKRPEGGGQCDLAAGARVVYRTNGLVYAGDNLDTTIVDCRLVDESFLQIRASLYGVLYAQEGFEGEITLDAQLSLKTTRTPETAFDD